MLRVSELAPHFCVELDATDSKHHMLEPRRSSSNKYKMEEVLHKDSMSNRFEVEGKKVRQRGNELENREVVLAGHFFSPGSTTL